MTSKCWSQNHYAPARCYVSEVKPSNSFLYRYEPVFKLAYVYVYPGLDQDGQGVAGGIISVVGGGLTGPWTGMDSQCENESVERFWCLCVPAKLEASGMHAAPLLSAPVKVSGTAWFLSTFRGQQQHCLPVQKVLFRDKRTFYAALSVDAGASALMV